jgi:hypothetical protein
LIEISDFSVEQCRAADPKQKSCNENVNIEDVFFDCNRRAWGGLQINATMGANIGPDIYFLNFMHAGLTLHGGHESMLHEAWLGATYYGSPNHTQSEAGSVAIEILGNDHIIVRSIATLIYTAFDFSTRQFAPAALTATALYRGAVGCHCVWWAGWCVLQRGC